MPKKQGKREEWQELIRILSARSARLDLEIQEATLRIDRHKNLKTPGEDEAGGTDFSIRRAA